MATWPTSLPQKFLQDGFSDEEPDYVLITEMEAAVPKIRKRFSAAIRPFGGKMILTQAQKATLKTFYRDYCGTSFLFPDPDTGTNITCIFLSKPTYDSASGIYQNVNIKLGQKP